MNQKVSTFICLSFFVSSPAALASGHTPGSHTNYTFPGAPAGFYSVDYSIQINKDPGVAANTFWANQFSLIGASGGYTGMQSNGESKQTFLFSVWNASEAKIGTEGSYCLKFGGEGEGYSCRMNYPWKEGGVYQFNLAHTGNGWFKVTVTATEPDDGSNKVHSFVLGSIKTTAIEISSSDMVNWTEYFEWSDSRATCLGQPYSSATFSFPEGMSVLAVGHRFRAETASVGTSEDCRAFSSVTPSYQKTGTLHQNGIGNSQRTEINSNNNNCMAPVRLSENAEIVMAGGYCKTSSQYWVYSKAGTLETPSNYCLASTSNGELRLRTCQHDQPEFQWVVMNPGEIRNVSTSQCLTDNGLNNKVTLNNCDGSDAQNFDMESDTGKGCIVSLKTGDEYCLRLGENSGYALPDWIKGHDVYVRADPFTSVTLSDWSNLSYKRTATFIGTVENEELKKVRADNGELLDFSRPFSMAVNYSETPVGCIQDIKRPVKYCLPAWKTNEYSLPGWIYGRDVSVMSPYYSEVSVRLSDWDNLSYNRIATFTDAVVPNENLKHVMADNGEYLDFSKPHSMMVIGSGSSGSGSKPGIGGHPPGCQDCIRP